jgi:RNA polymerase subunit RPABC4/transcription elongation factor Spt4
MRCAVCGKEFGTGNNCQHCGSDKFTGLGNYCGYNAPVGNGNTPIQAEGIDNQSTNYLLQTENVGVIACYACGEIIPADSKFCPYCSKELYVKCFRFIKIFEDRRAFPDRIYYNTKNAEDKGRINFELDETNLINHFGTVAALNRYSIFCDPELVGRLREIML